MTSKGAMCCIQLNVLLVWVQARVEQDMLYSTLLMLRSPFCNFFHMFVVTPSNVRSTQVTCNELLVKIKIVVTRTRYVLFDTAYAS